MLRQTQRPPRYIGVREFVFTAGHRCRNIYIYIYEHKYSVSKHLRWVRNCIRARCMSLLVKKSRLVERTAFILQSVNGMHIKSCGINIWAHSRLSMMMLCKKIQSSAQRRNHVAHQWVGAGGGGLIIVRPALNWLSWIAALT